MFDTLQQAPPDAILGLNEAFRADPNPDKINLSVGVYQDANGKTPVLQTVKTAEHRLLDEEDSKSYLGIAGDPDQRSLAQELIFGIGHPLVGGGTTATVQTPGGTGALRIGGDFIKRTFGGGTVWLSEPTWPNHPGVFKAAGLDIKTYPYYDQETKSLNFDAMIGTLEQARSGDIVVLHGCCHNPTGMDPTIDQWGHLASLTESKEIVPFFDFAYQGFGDGLDEDAAGVRQFLKPGRELLIASSYSKNFSLYNERVGALTLVTHSREAAEAALSHVKLAIRANYSNPPAHGAKIIATILKDTDLRAKWEVELAEMRDRINAMRKLFDETIKAKGVKRDFGFLTKQRGMFSFSGLTKRQVVRLRDEYSIYMVESGRINVAGITPSNIDRLCECIAKVLEE